MLPDSIKENIPASAYYYVRALWEDHPFRMRVTGNRTSKLGDYRYRPGSKDHEITVNGTLNRYTFLLTLIHEIAHQHVKIDHPGRVQPHGREWKSKFRALMLPVLNPDVFPDDILRPLSRHMRNPKASSSADPVLHQALGQHNPVPSEGPRVGELAPGDSFIYRNHPYKVLKHNRTRSLCLQLKTQRKYLVPMMIEVRISDQ